MATRLYTIGYTGLPWQIFADALSEHAIGTVVDIRSLPTSREEAYDGRTLPARLAELGIDYVALPDLGDLDVGEEADDAAVEAGVGRVLDLCKGGPTLLLCHEASPQGCRRAEVATRLVELGIAAAHLEPAGRLG